jgi:hypothetical protein
MRGNASYISCKPCSVAAMRGSVCSVALSGGGTGAADSQAERPHLRVRGDELAQCGRAGSRQTDDEDRALDHLVGDFRMFATGLLDL